MSWRSRPFQIAREPWQPLPSGPGVYPACPAYATHRAVIVASGRLVPVTRLGGLLLVHRPPRYGRADCVATCRYDSRFHLLPRGV